MAGRSRAKYHRARDRLHKNVRDPRPTLEPIEYVESDDVPERTYLPVRKSPQECSCPCFCARYKARCLGECCSCEGKE